jgi:hypothetical protein
MPIAWAKEIRETVAEIGKLRILRVARPQARIQVVARIRPGMAMHREVIILLSAQLAAIFRESHLCWLRFRQKRRALVFPRTLAQIWALALETTLS